MSSTTSSDPYDLLSKKKEDEEILTATIGKKQDQLYEFKIYDPSCIFRATLWRRIQVLEELKDDMFENSHVFFQEQSVYTYKQRGTLQFISISQSLNRSLQLVSGLLLKNTAALHLQSSIQIHLSQRLTLLAPIWSHFVVDSHCHGG